MDIGHRTRDREVPSTMDVIIYLNKLYFRGKLIRVQSGTYGQAHNECVYEGEILFRVRILHHRIGTKH